MKINLKRIIIEGGIFLLFSLFFILSVCLNWKDILKVISIWLLIIWTGYLYFFSVSEWF